MIHKGIISKAADVYSLALIIKSLQLDGENKDLLTPKNFSVYGLTELVESMLNKNYQLRPSLV
jgi:hypothetical protein